MLCVTSWWIKPQAPIPGAKQDHSWWRISRLWLSSSPCLTVKGTATAQGQRAATATIQDSLHSGDILLQPWRPQTLPQSSFADQLEHDTQFLILWQLPEVKTQEWEVHSKERPNSLLLGQERGWGGPASTLVFRFLVNRASKHTRELPQQSKVPGWIPIPNLTELKATAGTQATSYLSDFNGTLKPPWNRSSGASAAMGPGSPTYLAEQVIWVMPSIMYTQWVAQTIPAQLADLSSVFEEQCFHPAPRKIRGKAATSCCTKTTANMSIITMITHLSACTHILLIMSGWGTHPEMLHKLGLEGRWGQEGREILVQERNIH